MGTKINDFIEHKLNGMQGLLDNKIRPLLVNEAKSKAYWKDRSGDARRGLKGGVEVEGRKYTLYLAHSEEYGQWLEEGTGIYGPMHRPIVPVNKKVLSWLDEDGKRHFAKKVKGMKPMSILRDTLEKNKNNVANEIIRYWSE
ncbi:MAG: hypothetical protein LKE46_01850 [Clostridium sp.]|uniref:hypothetical protein n=1 Tax=Clostridium sp. TaxID=1506 RepID=UPI0025C446C4|nr:hypothetical protein [Clostridium sp.]MCH3962994.1 hypothetical protein [Clostridium sp.]MCI1800203.1 hypothetical protein [Clostridium sp.]MCI2202073.1 hypothetical protein [Clostridium sp.]